MGKRSDFKRVERDYYPTPYHAVEPLLPHLEPGTFYIEPCAGDYRLAEHLGQNGHLCVEAVDIEPRHHMVKEGDMFDISTGGYMTITNPPWDRKILHPAIEHFRQDWCWLLFDADWPHTRQASEYMKYCAKIVSVGRVKWFNNQAGKDNAAWYLFGPEETQTIFYGR